MELNTIKEWYANRTNKAVTDFDEVDLFVCKVAYDFTIEQVKKCSVLDAVMQALPKRLSNTAYLKAKEMRYEDFVKWWDEQV